MPSVCFYFQVHQPLRLKHYSFFNIGNDHSYEDEALNREILNKVSDKCYLPSNKMMLDLIKKHDGKFKIALSISGLALEQFEKYRPDVLESFQALAKTKCVEFLSETYYHSLAFLYSKEEFARQVEKHKKKIQELFGQKPAVFRNTELIYNNDLANFITKMGYKAILSEGVDWILNGRSFHYVYMPPSTRNLKILLKNFRLSDDIAFRFSNQNWAEFPLTADKYARWIHNYSRNSDTINIFMDYETFGEHQWESTGIFDFMKHLPGEILKNKSFTFNTPSEVADMHQIKGVYDVGHTISWADTERDLSAWISNPMQSESLVKLYSMEDDIKKLNDEKLLETWSMLQASDHFYYMCTKYWADGAVHKYFSPYKSPYDSYIYYINVLSDLELVISQKMKVLK
ncbi:MAG TPA: glycoside hydrolase family 57 protein [Cytophagaceae bacterium]|nr:glycoside hydrolase family 57 protein [Cytophagaceae bacterium]